MIDWISEIPVESIILIEGVVKQSDREIRGATIKDMEIKAEKVSSYFSSSRRLVFMLIRQLYLITSPEGILPFDLADASRAESEYQKEDTQHNRVHLDHRLNNRVLDLRV